MMTVGDEERLVAHELDDLRERPRVLDFREAMRDAVRRGEACDLARGAESAFELARRIAIQHEAWTEVRGSGAEKLQPIFFRAGERAFVRKDDAIGERHELHEPEKPATRDGVRGAGRC